MPKQGLTQALMRQAAAAWGQRGGRARAANLTPEERAKSASLAAQRRWAAWRDAGQPPLPKRRRRKRRA
jgi:hypothetical protein